MDAQGALDSLLGRLTIILVDEARLLGGLQGDVEFIKDEMESMNGLLLHLTEAHHRDHQVRAWMKQVVGLTRDCEGNVELYIHSVTGAGHLRSSFLGYFRRIIRYVRTIPERHRIATRIRELKVRARDVGDRKLRYGVTVPKAAYQEDVLFMDDVHAPHGPEAEVEDARRRALLLNCSWPDDREAYNQKIMDDTIKSVLLCEEEPVDELANGESHQRIFLMTLDGYSTIDSNFTNLIAKKLYEQEISSFSCKAYVYKLDSVVEVLREILHQVAPLPAEQEAMPRVEADKSTETSLGDDKKDEAMQLSKKLEGFLKGKRFLIVLENVFKEDWNTIRSALLHVTAHGSPGSAIVITARYDDLVESPYEILKPQTLFAAFCSKAMELARCSEETSEHIYPILRLCYTDVFAMKMFQHLLYVNPRRGKTQLHHLKKTLEGCLDANKSVGKQMLKISYNDLPAKYRTCLFYLTIFPEGDPIRRTTVCRRWIAEGLITSRENRAEDEADSYFDALFAWGFIQPGETSDTGKIKTCTLHAIVREVITRIARDVNFVDTDLPPDLARHLPVHSRTGLQTSHANHSVKAADGNNGIVAFLPYLAKSSQWQLMKMLDLEGCRGLKKQHLKSICKIILLKYLCLRNTDITELPKQIERLQYLETLDIRQTAVQSFATKSIMLPMLKHLLAGQAESPSNSSDGPQDLFTAVRLPSSIRRMEQLETLSHVEASHRLSDLTDVGHLLRLRKLGVILSCKKGGLGLLFQQLEKLHCCLRSLSIQINQPPKVEDTLAAEEVITLVSPPKLLQSLNIRGIRSDLLMWIADLDQLTKITISETYLSEDYASILGKLTAMRCLRLRHNSYARSRLTFKDGEFKSLKSLVVEDGIIINITFDTGAAPKLETIVWSFATMESISGVLCLPKLKNVELNGDCDPHPVRQELEEHPNSVDFKHKPLHGHQEDGATVAASTSMSK